MNSSWRLADEAETIRAGESIGRVLVPGDALLLTGDLGAGKTTLVRGIAAGLGVRDRVASPSFTIERIYLGDPEKGNLEIRHVDLYRLESEREIRALALSEAQADGAVVLVEWGERMPANELVEPRRVVLSPDGEGRRLELDASLDAVIRRGDPPPFVVL